MAALYGELPLPHLRRYTVVRVMYGDPFESQFEIFPRSNPFANLGAHKTMLADIVRLQAFESALKETIVPGESVVADIGTGTGILALMAARAGARRVYAIDSGPTIELARELARDNNLDTHITFLREDARSAALPEPVDIVVSETIGLIGIEENIVKIMHTARERFAHERTLFIPSHLSLVFAPVHAPEIAHEIASWKRSIANFDFSRVYDLAMNNIYGRFVFTKGNLLAQPCTAHTYTLGADLKATQEISCTFPIEHSAEIHGYALWFNAQLSTSHALTSSIDAEKTHWQQSFIPVEASTLEKGDSAKLRITINDSDDLAVSWQSEIVRRDGSHVASAKHSSERLLLFTRV